MSDDQSLFMIEAEISAGQVEVWLNDIPVFRLEAGKPPASLAVPANFYIIPGLNVLELRPAPWMSRASSQGISAKVKLASYRPGQFEGDADARLWASTALNVPQGMPIPDQAMASADLGHGLPAWEWLNARPHTLVDDTLRAEIAAVLAPVRDDLERGSSAALERVAEPRFRAAVQAYPARSMAEILTLLRQTTADKAAQPDWGMEPILSERLMLRLCGNGRLVQPLDPDWRPALRSRPGGRPQEYPLFLARLADAWMIVL